MSKNHCLIMAGGAGTRFWPRSRVSKPKQYLNLFGNQSLIQETISRFARIVPAEDIFVVSAKGQKEILQQQTANIPRCNLIFEPVGKNTLPAIGLSAMILALEDPEGILIVTPSDHLIANDQLFLQTIDSATRIADQTDGIVTIGITPKFPAIGYGYIQVADEVNMGQAIKSFSVQKFVEKPNLNVAKEYLQQGGYFWNSGIFLFKISVFLESLKKLAPVLYNDLIRIQDSVGTDSFDATLENIYHEVESISIDYGILEKADNVFLVQGDFEWNDLGSWEEVYKYDQKDENQNAKRGEVIFQDTQNSYVFAPDSLVALVGMQDVIVVQEGNTILVCKRNHAEEIKQVVGEISRRKLDQYL